MALDATIHEDPAALAPVRGAWDELAAVCGRPCSSSAWMLGWACHVGRGDLRVAVVREGSEVVGVLPGIVERDPAGTRRWRLLGAGTATTIDPLARPGREVEVAAAAATALARTSPRIDVVALEGVPTGSPWPRLLAEGWPGARPGMLFEELVQPEPVVRLVEDGFDAWLAGRSSNFRGQVRRARRALARDGGTVRRPADPDGLARDLRAFVRLHEARWESRGGSGVVGPEVQAMLGDAGPALLADGRLDLWCVDVKDETVGAQLWLRAGGVTTMWLSGSDDAHAAVRPAMLIMAAAVEDGFETGLSVVSFGSGGQDYKRRFTEDEEAVAWSTLVLPGPRLGLALGAVGARRGRRELARRLGDERKARLRALADRIPGRG